MAANVQDMEKRVDALENELARLKASTGRGRPMQSVRKRSTHVLCGWPLYDIAIGPDPECGQKRGFARGIFAIGDIALGIVSLGGVAMGLFAVGGVSIGLILGAGGLALGSCALGGAAIGGIAIGGATVGFVAIGGAAIGYYTYAAAAYGAHVIGR